jgi:hypothetical protein
MQTTLRIQDAIYREAKIEAAREGISITRLIEDALRCRLGRGVARKGKLPTFDSGRRLPANFDLVAAVKEAETAADRLLARELLAVKPRGRNGR